MKGMKETDEVQSTSEAAKKRTKNGIE